MECCWWQSYLLYKIILYLYRFRTLPTTTDHRGFVRFGWSSFARQRKQNNIVLQLLLQVNPNLILIDHRGGHYYYYYYYFFYGGRRQVYMYNTPNLFMIALRGFSFCRYTMTCIGKNFCTKL